MKALSIRQPWVDAILHRGKMVENRDWSACHYRGPILLHAGKACTRREYAEGVESIQIMRDDLGVPLADVPPLDHLPRGGFVGIARLVEVRRHPTSGTVSAQGHDGVVRDLDWSRGYLGYRLAGALGLELADVRELPFIPFKGALGLFDAWLGDHADAAAYRDAYHELEAATRGGR